MRKNIQNLTRFVCALTIIVIGNYVIVAQNALTGDWRAEVKSEKNAEKIHLSFERRGESGNRNQTGSNFDYADLQGLTRERAQTGGAANFSLVREAGTVECAGNFVGGGKGAGTFRFVSNPSFVAAMKTRGFDFAARQNQDAEERLFTAALLNVTIALADDLLAADFGKLDAEDLFKAAIFKIDAQFIKEMKASGFPNLGMEDLVKARIFKIDADFVKEIAAMGFDKENFEAFVKMRIFKITPRFIEEARGAGLTDLAVEDLVKMKIFNIDAAFIRDARADGVPLEVEKLVERRIGVGRR